MMDIEKHSKANKLTNDEIAKLLEDYTKVKSSELKRGFHVRYFKKNPDGTLDFRLGGFVLDISGLPTYIIMSNGKVQWSVQCKTAIFYQKMTDIELFNELNETIKKKDDEIDDLREYIRMLEKQIKQLKKNTK